MRNTFVHKHQIIAAKLMLWVYNVDNFDFNGFCCKMYFCKVESIMQRKSKLLPLMIDQFKTQKKSLKSYGERSFQLYNILNLAHPQAKICKPLSLTRKSLQKQQTSWVATLRYHKKNIFLKSIFWNQF